MTKLNRILAIDTFRGATNALTGSRTNNGGGGGAFGGGGGGTGSADGTAMDNAMIFSAGVTIEGRWKYVDIDDEAIVYLKSAPSQTF